MAKTATAQKELTFAERLTQALNGIEQAQTMMAEAQAAYDQAKAAVQAELKSLPLDHPLRTLGGMSSSGTKASSNGSGKRTRAKGDELEAIRDSILSQLKDKGKLKRGDFDKESYRETTFMAQVKKLVSEGKVKQEGTKAGAGYVLK